MTTKVTKSDASLVTTLLVATKPIPEITKSTAVELSKVRDGTFKLADQHVWPEPSFGRGRRKPSKSEYPENCQTFRFQYQFVGTDNKKVDAILEIGSAYANTSMSVDIIVSRIGYRGGEHMSRGQPHRNFDYWRLNYVFTPNSKDNFGDLLTTLEKKCVKALDRKIVRDKAAAIQKQKRLEKSIKEKEDLRNRILKKHSVKMNDTNKAIFDCLANNITNKKSVEKIFDEMIGSIK